MDDERVLLTVGQAATRLSLSKTQVYELAAAGEIPKRFIGNGKRNYRLAVEDVDKYAASLPTEPKPTA